MSNQSVIADPLVSIVVPVYNVSRYLPQCLESVIHQTYKNIEIIIIDDGSTDSSGLICDQYADADLRIRALHTENHGLAAARNLGIENAHGSFLLFTDSDDWIENNTIEVMAKEALQIGADIVVARKCTEYVGRTIHARPVADRIKIFTGYDIMDAFASGKFGNIAWNKLYHASCFQNIRYPGGYNYEDVATTWRILYDLAEKGGKLTFLSDELFHFRVRKSSITHSKSAKNIIDCWAAYHGKYEALPDYRDKLLTECFIPISKMWMSFCGLSKEEQLTVATVMMEMWYFSNSNFKAVIEGNYSILTKTTCLFSQIKTMPVLFMYYRGHLLYSVIKGIRYKMYD